MIRFNQKLFVASAIALVALTSFKATEQSAFANTSTGTKPVAAAPVKTSGFTALQSVVAKTKSSVDAGNFAKAKEEFSKFGDAWKKVEDGLKKKSPSAYKSIETSVEAVTKNLKAAKPDKAKLVAALQSLDRAISKAAKM